MTQFILKITCVDRPGIVAGVAHCIAGQGGNIIESAQYSDEATGVFFMRIAFAPPPDLGIDAMRTAFAPVAERFGLDWQIHDAARKMRAAIMVSNGGHCLNDLLYRTATGRLPMDITSVISNHKTWQRRVEHEGITYHHLPVTPETKMSQEAALVAILEEQQVDLLILARYMQVLSNDLCSKYRAGLSTSTTASCRASKAQNHITARTRAASKWWAQPRITSPPTSMKARLSRRTYRWSIMPTASMI